MLAVDIKYPFNFYLKAFDLISFCIMSFNTELSFPAASIFGDFDLIFCANVLFYYKPEFQSLIINKLKKGLSKEGYIITGEAERTIFLNNNFKEEFPHSAIFKI